ncbi:hypothetical protein [Marinilactibacillus kalidii]|uniref:hypothetical protein n=1 Tax=Marinilactibacillus kalidii TaxID=2820274 RepID=UPI001ABE8FD5|nr:hypothetical protein [Marinilactibacillus kalidii]
MEEKVEQTQAKTFPWGALAIYLGVVFASAIIEGFVFNEVPLEGFGADSIIAVGVIGIIVGALILFIGTMFQYVFIKFPTQWVAKDEHVYKYDIWSALFLSNAVSVVLSFIIDQIGYGENLFIAAIASLITTVLFLFFYFSGEEKERHVKRAMMIVRITWFVIGVVLLSAIQVLISNMSIY